MISGDSREKASAAAEDMEERVYLVKHALVENSQFNCPNVHLMMYWADQI